MAESKSLFGAIYRNPFVFTSTLMLFAIVAACGVFGEMGVASWALAMPVGLLAGQDIARLIHEFSPSNRDPLVPRLRFAPLFGALLFHGLAIGTVFVAHAQMSRNRVAAGECAGCGGGGGCGSGCCGGSAATATKSASGCGCGAAKAAPKATSGCGCGGAAASAKASSGCGCASAKASPVPGQPAGAAAVRSANTAPPRVQGVIMPPNRALNVMMSGKAPGAAPGQNPVPSGDAKANGNTGPGVRTLYLPPGIRPPEPKSEAKPPTVPAVPVPKANGESRLEEPSKPSAPSVSPPEGALMIPSSPVSPPTPPTAAEGEKKTSWLESRPSDLLRSGLLRSAIWEVLPYLTSWSSFGAWT